MRFLLRIKDGYGERLRDGVARFLERNGCDWTGDLGKKCDFAVILGGDGTLLRDQSELDCPVLGVNPGKSVGYYLRATKDDYEEKLLRLINGKQGKDYHVHSLTRLEASVNGRAMKSLALNDVLVSPIYVRRVLKASIELHTGRSVERNSGIIVYTPTGSHAFAHSAGARMLPYDSKSMGIAAFAPYSGTLKKSEILLDRGPVKIECLSEEGEVCIDGSEVNIKEIKEGDIVTVEKSGSPFRLVGFSSRFES